MGLEDFSVIDAEEAFADWLVEFDIKSYKSPDETSKLQDRKLEAGHALEMHGFDKELANIKDKYWQTRLQGLALILGDLHFKRCDSDADYQKYYAFVETYEKQIEKAKAYL